MPASWFDDRFVVSGTQSHSLSMLRIGLAPIVLLLLELVHAEGAVAWFMAVLAVEIFFRWVTAPMARGEPVSARRRWLLFGAYWLAVPAWSCPALLLWLTPDSAAHVAAAAYFGGHLLYLQAHHSQSPGAMIPAAPAIVAPLLAPLLLPQHQGPDQVAVLLIMAGIVGHAIWSIAVASRASGRFAQVVGELRAEKRAAEAARAEMAAAKDEADAASRAKSVFLATMSHEIRTPLNGLLGMAQVMERDELPSAQRERLMVVRRSGENLLAILNDVLDLSKIEAGRMQLEDSEFDIEEWLEAAATVYRPLAAAKGLTFDLAVSSRVGGIYRGDPGRLRQIIDNLVTNAIKFTHEGGVTLAVRRRKGGLTLSVRDTGIGIAPQDLVRLFEKFEQADASTTRRFGGTGLGLAICRELAQRMGGEIMVRSTPGRGATFRVDIPLARIRTAASQPCDGQASPPAPIPEGFRVLVAEDNATNQLLLRTILQQAGIACEVVGDGEQVVAAWVSGAFDLILMDVQMPTMDGPSATRAIRAREAEAGRPRTPIVGLTANVMAHQVRDYRAAGMDSVLPKPIDVALLIQTIASLGPRSEVLAAA